MNIFYLFSASLNYEKELEEINFVASKILQLPKILNCTKLRILDARSCDLNTLPRPLFSPLKSIEFLLDLVGNKIVDVAADILLPIPAKSTINVDSHVSLFNIC